MAEGALGGDLSQDRRETVPACPGVRRGGGNPSGTSIRLSLHLGTPKFAARAGL